MFLAGFPPPDLVPQVDRDEILGLVYFYDLDKYASHVYELGTDSYLAKHLRGDCNDQPHWHAWLRRGF